MAKNNKQQQTNKAAPAPKPVITQKQRSLNGPFGLKVHLFIVTGIAIVAWLFMSVCLHNQLGLWDDTPYIVSNRLVKDISWEGIRNIFSTPSMGNYHPLTILSFAIEYSLVKLEPWLYHFDNLLLHAGVMALVYWLVLLLTKRTVAAVTTALLFALHPMHVESVAWVASRKDLLCALFYFGACIAYVYYQRAKGRRGVLYAATVILFICSLLSKAIAVTLPLSLLLIDYFEGRAIGKKTITEKMPHFLLALVFGIIAIKAQHTAGAMEMSKATFNPIERVALGFYALTTYLWKAMLPVQLHCLYPYPSKVNGALPYIYYLYPLLVTGMIFVAWKFARKNKVVVFGLLFFLVNMLLLLQFLAVGDAIVAERYSYIPYFGLFFIAGYYVSDFFVTARNKQYRLAVSVIALSYIGLLGYLSNERCSVWYDEMSLWHDETEKEPATGVRAFNNLGYIYYSKWQTENDPATKNILYDSAVYFMNKAIKLQPDFVNPYLALGELERSAGKYDSAKITYFHALIQNPKEGNIYFGLAIVHYTLGNMDSAGYYFRKVIDVQPNAQAYGNYGNYLTFVGKDDSALIAFTKAVSMTKDDYVPYMNRGSLYKKMNRWDEARKDYAGALKINPDAGELYYLRSFCDTQMKDNAQAIKDVDKALSLGYKKVDMGYYDGLKGK